MTSSSLTSLLIPAALILIIAAGVLAAILTTRREVRRKRETALQLGFQPLEPGAALTEKIAALYRSERTTGRVELQSVARKPLAGGEIYLFDLLDHSANQETSNKANQEVAVFSPSLDLPRFKLFPNMGGEGAAAQLAAQALRWVFARSDPLVEFPDNPQFAQTCMVVAPDPHAARAFFTPARMNYLVHAGPLALKAGGDGFLCASINPQQAQRSTPELTARRVQQAADVLEMFIS